MFGLALQMDFFTGSTNTNLPPPCTPCPAALSLSSRSAMRRQILSPSRCLARSCRRFKAFEDGFRVFRGNAGTGIGDGEGDVSGMLCEGAVQADFALCGVFLCIGKEVDEYLAHTLPVGAQFVAVVHFGGVVELHAFGLAVFNGGYGFPAELVATVRRYLHGVSVAFQLGCAEDVPHQCKEEVGIVLYEMAEFLPFLLGKVRVWGK